MLKDLAYFNLSGRNVKNWYSLIERVKNQNYGLEKDTSTSFTLT